MFHTACAFLLSLGPLDQVGAHEVVKIDGLPNIILILYYRLDP